MVRVAVRAPVACADEQDQPALILLRHCTTFGLV